MFVEVHFHPESCWATVTGIGFGTRVCEHVVLQSVVAGQILEAKRARIRPDPRVHLHVSVEHVPESKGPWTLIALEGTLLRMDQMQVADHFALLLKSLQTVFALKLLLVRMTLQVCLVLRHQDELLLAKLTRVPFHRVRFLMCPQDGPVLKDLPTDVAAKVSLVHQTVMSTPCLDGCE